MSELRERLELAVDNITYKVTTTPPGTYAYQIDREKLISEIIAAFKAHIEACKPPTIPTKPIYTIQTSQGGDVPSEIMIQAWSACVEAFRKALMESLE